MYLPYWAQEINVINQKMDFCSTIPVKNLHILSTENEIC
jgi:hypothetical protein